MKQLFFISTAGVFILSSCATTILKHTPADGDIPYNQVVYVENDGRCKNGQVIRLVGGNLNSEIPRKIKCVNRPL